jgi:deoxyribodipyrimidine photo-lyase
MGYTLFIFRRDLRIRDNNGLRCAIKNFENVVPIFIFTPEQVTSENKYRSDNSIQFMMESLDDLNTDLGNKLHYFYGDNIKVLETICKKIQVDNIAFNVDYTKYARERDGDIIKFCKSKKIEVSINEDYLLSKIGEFNKDDGKGESYVVFTPFKNNAVSISNKVIKTPTKYQVKNIVKVSDIYEASNKAKVIYDTNENIILKGGRKNAINQLLSAVRTNKKYNTERDTMSIETTRLSAYIKFGCLSIREVYWAFKEKLGKDTLLLSQLFWREFYYYIAYYYPDVVSNKHTSFRDTFDKIKWTNKPAHFTAWCNGTTGFPIVDAGMRQLNKSGYMHNRARLITANFLNRILNIDWRKGEMYYATKLIDYDPSVNNGNWQWVASTGVDTSQYFQRVFSPINQSKKYDPDAEYIKHWIPELKDITPAHLHDWEKYKYMYTDQDLKYTPPIISYSYGRTRSLKAYKTASEKN